MMDVNEIENQRNVSEFDCLSLNFRLIWSVFVDLNVLRYCSIEINGKKEKASRLFCQCRRSVYGPVATMTVMWLFSFNLQPPGVGKFLCI